MSLLQAQPALGGLSGGERARLCRPQMWVRPDKPIRASYACSQKKNAPGAEDQRRLALLSDRELVVLRLVAQGYSGPRIGAQLAISAKTVDTYRQRINEKLDLSGRPEYVRFALRVGLLATESALTMPSLVC